jgi:hypothetical protein
MILAMFNSMLKIKELSLDAYSNVFFKLFGLAKVVI